MSLIPLGFWAASGGGGGGAAFDLLETQTLASAASSVTFTGLGSYSDYKHLQIRYVARNASSGFYRYIRFTFNGDTGANYSSHRLEANGSSVSSSALTTRNQIDGARVIDNNLTANSFDGGVLDLLDFSSVTKAKTIRYIGGHTSSTYPFVALGSGRWGSTAAVTSINIFNDGTSFITGSRFSLYGVK